MTQPPVRTAPTAGPATRSARAARPAARRRPVPAAGQPRPRQPARPAAAYGSRLPYGRRPSGSRRTARRRSARAAPPGGYGQPPQKKKGLLPWIIVGAAVLVSGVGVTLGRPADRRTTDRRRPGTAATSSSSSVAATSSVGASATRTPPPATCRAARRSPSRADEPRPVRGLRRGRARLGAGNGRRRLPDAPTTSRAPRCRTRPPPPRPTTGDPAWELGTYFYEQTLGGAGFTEGTFDSIDVQPSSGQRHAPRSPCSWTTASTFTLLVYVDPDLTVCDFF